MTNEALARQIVRIEAAADEAVEIAVRAAVGPNDDHRAICMALRALTGAVLLLAESQQPS